MGSNPQENGRMQIKTKQRSRTILLACVFSVLLLSIEMRSFGQCFTVPLPQVGEREFCISQSDSAGELIEPEAPAITPFRPPSIFSAPLPSGSGARAMGLAGAFTALADDATAASWNPAGLVRLERPEASIVFRLAREKDKHRTSDSSLEVTEDDFENENLNYFSLVYPFTQKVLNRNIVVSLNYQEAYDFAQQFTAQFNDRSTRRLNPRTSETMYSVFTERITQQGDAVQAELDVTIQSRKEKTTELDQHLLNSIAADIGFDQKGIIDATTPAIAFELTPKLFFGASLNVYQDSPVGHDIRSETRAVYSGTSSSEVNSRTVAETFASYSYEGILHFSSLGGFKPFDWPVDGQGNLEPISEVTSSQRNDSLPVEGDYEEINVFDDVRGMNATFGLLWNPSRNLSLGASIDLPWTAKADQKRRVRQKVTTFNAARTRTLDVSATQFNEVKNVEFRFPGYWSLGALWRWTSHLYSTLDISQTLWSDFSFQAEGEDRINPLDGSSHREHPLDDAWSIRTGTEYLIVGPKSEIPLRMGFAWEQRPALEKPDDYYLVTAGSGFALGQEDQRTIIDIAYVFTYGKGVRGVIPEDADLTSDVTEHQVFLSFIQHF